MRALFDVNVLIALIQPDHAHHQAAHQWWNDNRAEGWASCPLTQNGFVRIVSQPKYPAALTPDGAVGLLRRAVSTDDHVFWPDDVSLVDASVFDHARLLGPRQITDAYLIALAVKNGGRLVTFDHAVPLAAVRGVGPQHTVVLS